MEGERETAKLKAPSEALGQLSQPYDINASASWPPLAVLALLVASAKLESLPQSLRCRCQRRRRGSACQSVIASRSTAVQVQRRRRRRRRRRRCSAQFVIYLTRDKNTRREFS